MGLQEILDEINQEAKQQAESILNEAKVMATKTLMARTEELEKIYERKRRVLDEEIQRIDKKLRSRAELDAQKESYRLESDMVNSLIDDAFEKTVSHLKSNSPKYIDFLCAVVESASKTLGVKQLTVSFNPEDESLFENLSKKSKIKLTLGESARIRAGVICTHNKTSVDHSIEAIFRTSRPELVRLIVSELAEPASGSSH